jgi:hypothetical protein
MKKQTAVEWLQEALSLTFEQEMKFEGLFQQAKEMESEQLEKELNRFFLYFRDNGERFIGMSIEQFVKKYLEGK